VLNAPCFYYCNSRNICTFVELKKEIMYSFIFLGVIGPWQIVLIVAVVLLIFGGKKIPELMRGLGQGMKEFKKATKDDTASEEEKEIEKK